MLHLVPGPQGRISAVTFPFLSGPPLTFSSVAHPTLPLLPHGNMVQSALAALGGGNLKVLLGLIMVESKVVLVTRDACLSRCGCRARRANRLTAPD